MHILKMCMLHICIIYLYIYVYIYEYTRIYIYSSGMTFRQIAIIKDAISKEIFKPLNVYIYVCIYVYM
jgi:hypothetical protein